MPRVKKNNCSVCGRYDVCVLIGRYWVCRSNKCYKSFTGTRSGI